MKFDRDRDGEPEREEGDRVPAAEAARLRFLHAQPGKTVQEERVFQTVRTTKEQKKRRQSLKYYSRQAGKLKDGLRPCSAKGERTDFSVHLRDSARGLHQAKVLEFDCAPLKDPCHSVAFRAFKNVYISNLLIAG